MNFGILIPGTTSIALEDRLIWRYGLAKTTDDGQQAVFACLCDWRELIVQSLICSIGRQLQLPIPKCYIIAANESSFPETRTPKTSYLFGCQASPHPTIAAFARQIGDVADLLMTVSKDVSNRLIILDEWAVNEARAATAMLIDPSSGLLFIDYHSALFLIADFGIQLGNWVHDITQAAAVNLDKARLRRTIQHAAGRIFDIDIAGIGDTSSVWLDDDQRGVLYELVDYLADRRHNLEELFCKRLGIDELQLKFVA
jgi:hypothetical protein